MDFDGKVVVVAGGGSGIGRAAAERFATGGATVVVADIDEDGAVQTTKGSASDRVSARLCDVTVAAQCRELIESTRRDVGGIDVVVNAVGWTDVRPFLGEDEDYWRRIVDLNLMSTIFLTHAAATAMVAQDTGGAIVLVSSDAGRVGTSGESVYAAAKAGVIGLVKSLARELARHRIRVNCVAPGPTRTPLLSAQAADDLIERMIRGIPLRRLGEPEEPAEAIAFLASDRSSYITGQTLSVSGGLTMCS